MKVITNKFPAWLTAQTRLTRFFIVALLLHAVLLAIVGSIKIVATLPKVAVSFEAAPLLPPVSDKESDDPNAVYRDFEYKGATVGGGGGTPGKGAGGVPTAGSTPETYKAHILTPSAEAGQDNTAEVIGIMSDAATAIARPAGGPSGVGLTALIGMGDT